MITVDKTTDELQIMGLLIAAPGPTVFELEDYDYNKIKSLNFSKNCISVNTTWIPPNWFHRALMKVGLLPKSHWLLKMNSSDVHTYDSVRKGFGDEL